MMEFKELLSMGGDISTVGFLLYAFFNDKRITRIEYFTGIKKVGG